MDRRCFSNVGYMRHVQRTRVKFGAHGSCPIDQTPAQSFNIDPATGRPMSDVQKLTKMQDNLQMQALFSSLQEFKSDYLPADVSDADALKFICPRLSQLPSELLKYRDGLAKYSLERQLEAEKAAQLKHEEEARKQFMEELSKPKSE